MSRNKIEVNRILFARLENKLPDDSVAVKSFTTGPQSIRYIPLHKKKFAEEILTNADIIQTIEVFDKTKLFAISFAEKNYLIITGVSETSTSFLKGINTALDPDNNEQDLKKNPGLITLLFSLDEFPILTTDDIGYKLAEKIFNREGTKEGAFDASELTEYFSDFSIWELDNKFDCTNSNTLLALYSGYLIANKKNFNLNFQSDTLQNIKLLIEELPVDLIGGNLFRSIVSMEWKHSFLELYQCIEYLYPIPYLLKLSNSLGDSIHLQNLFKNTENDLDWRPKEAQALEKLLREIESKDSVSKMLLSVKSIFKITGEIKKDNEITVISKHIYQTRNSIAHFRSALKTEITNDLDWNALIEKLCEIMFDLYSKFSPQISSIK